MSHAMSNELETPVGLADLLARVEALTGDFYRVTLPDGRRGFLSARTVEPVDTPIEEALAAEPVALRAAPDGQAPVVETAGAGEPVTVLGAFGEYLLVKGESGRDAWMPADLRAADSDGP